MTPGEPADYTSPRPPVTSAEEKTLFARDVEPGENGERPQIDPFRYRRYLALGWISDRGDEVPPYYELTSNGEQIWQWWRTEKEAW